MLKAGILAKINWNKSCPLTNFRCQKCCY